MIRLLLLLLLPPVLLAAAPAGRSVTIVAAGDIACDPAHGPRGGPADVRARCHDRATAELIRALHPDAVLVLGDAQYFGEDLKTFATGYGASWGAFKSITHPVTGNHEYEIPGASGYFDYFGSAAGPRGKGWYSWNLGRWHFIALNGSCDEAVVGGCGTGSQQYRWLQADLRAHPRGCRLAYWHQPRFSCGPHGNDSRYAAFWKALYEAKADVVLAGHDHGYERFAALDPGERAASDGIREIIAGTGGRNHSPFFFPAHAESVARDNVTFGVLVMTLEPRGYRWRFAGEPGSTFQDSGRATCHRP